MRGRFTAGANADEWCDRRLLARIHNYTVKRLRAEIEPVAARDFLRFLFAWQHVTADEQREGPEALAATVKQLEGFEAPAGAWEGEILAARVDGLRTGLAGRRMPRRPRRLGAPQAAQRNRCERRRARSRARCARRRSRCSSGAARRTGARCRPMPRRRQPRPRAQAVADFIRDHGASFFDELVAGVGMLRTEVEEALAELVSLGVAASDSFVGLRALLVPSELRKLSAGGRRRRRTVAFGVEDAGRWALTRQAKAGEIGQQARSDAIEHAARILLLRYGVVFWRLLEREAGWLPPWRDLLRVYRRLEARGEIRGGRFVAGFSGEQFALPEAIGLLRETRRKKASGELISLSGADPLNLVGILTPGAEAAAAGGQSGPLSRRPADRHVRGRRNALLRRARSRRRVAGAKGAVGRADGAGRHRFPPTRRRS